MTRKKILIILSTFFLGLLLVLGLRNLFSENNQGPFLNSSQQSKSAIFIGNTKIYVDIADTPEKRKIGLADRNKLKNNEGMLFTFEKDNLYPIFWMKGMLFPIDIIWIDDGKIVQIDANLPAPKPETPDSEIAKYPAKFPVDNVLEVNAGFSEKQKIKVGDSVDLSNI